MPLRLWVAVASGGRHEGRPGGPFAMWAREEDGSHWIGGVVVDSQQQGRGIGRWLMRSLMDRLIVEPGCVNVALSYEPRRLRRPERSTARSDLSRPESATGRNWSPGGKVRRSGRPDPPSPTRRWKRHCPLSRPPLGPFRDRAHARTCCGAARGLSPGRPVPGAPLAGCNCAVGAGQRCETR